MGISFSENIKLEPPIIACFALFHHYPLVTRKRQWRYILDESAPFSSCLLPSFRL